jgi:hypothetical protein
MATKKPTTPTAPAQCYVKAPRPIPTTITIPGKTARSKDTVIAGRILGTQYAGGKVQHYRVTGDNGVVYLAPPDWLPEYPLEPADSFLAGLLRVVAVLKEINANKDSAS